MNPEQNNQLDINASCCMEIAGIESMFDSVEAPTVEDMMSGKSYRVAEEDFPKY